MKLFPRFILGLMVLLTVAQAQPLAELMPTDSFLTLSASQQSSVYDTIDDDIKALEWEKSKTALTKLLAYLGTTIDDELLPVIEVYEALLEGDFVAANKQVLEFCPAYESVLDKSQALMDEQAFVPYEALISVGANSISPMPAATALFRVSGDTGEALYADMFTTLLECAQEQDGFITTLEQDGVPLYVLGDGGDLPMIAGSLNNLYFFSTNPDAARAIIRLANGAQEESLADSAFYQTMTKLEPQENSVGLSVDFGAIAALLESFAPMFAEGDVGMTYAVERGVAMLRTLGTYTGHISATAEGLESEFLFATNPEGGDADLLKMINCANCQISSPFLAPEKANSVSSVYVPIRELIQYADSWVRGYGDAIESPMSIKDVAAQFGIDLDTLLLDWIGSEVHSFVLKPYNRDAGDLFYGLPQVSVMPVSSPEAAQAGLNSLGDGLWDIFALIMGEGAFSSSEAAGISAVLGSVAVRPYDYEGTTINRVQYSFTGDLGYAFIDNYLVLGTPANAIEMLIDTYQGAATILEDASYQAARERAPAELTIFAHSQDQANVHGLARVLELITQPLAASINTGLQAALLDGYVFEPYEAYLEEGIEAEPLALQDGLQMVALPKSAADEYGYITYYYELNNLPVGDEVTLDILSDDYDYYPYAMVLAVEDNLYIAESDYNDEGQSVSFIAEEGKTYWLELSGSYYGASTAYEAYLEEGVTAEPIGLGALEVSVEPEDADSSGYVSRYYELTDLPVGQSVSVSISSDDFFPSMSLLDRMNELYIADGTYQEDDSYGFTFTVEEGLTYWLEVYGSLYDSGVTYTLNVNPSDAVAISGDSIALSFEFSSQAAMVDGSEAVEPPSFAELLDAADLIPAVFAVIADHMSTSESYSYRDGNDVISKSKTFFRW